MRKFKVFILSVFFITTIFLNNFNIPLFAQSVKCPPPDQDYERGNADDNSSFSEGASNKFYFIPPDVFKNLKVAAEVRSKKKWR